MALSSQQKKDLIEDIENKCAEFLESDATKRQGDLDPRMLQVMQTLLMAFEQAKGGG